MTTALPLAPVPRPLLGLLGLVGTDADTFRAEPGPPTAMPVMFGGQIIAQSLAAASRTVTPGREPHSLHGYFLYPGDPAAPITYRVERVRDGHAFTSRRVTAVQDDGGEHAVFCLTVSFKRPTPRGGPEHQTPMPGVPAPEALADATELPPAYVHPAVIQRLRELRHAVDVRYVPGPRPAPETAAGPPATRLWFRARGPVPVGASDLHSPHSCLVAYLSDLTLLDTASPYHRSGLPNDGRGTAVSLDHAMWFHRPLRVDEWLLYEQQSHTSTDGRGLVHARIYTRDGTLAATVAQEGLIRLRRSPATTTSRPGETQPQEIDPYSWAVARPETD
ncbi:acyl-CoA thioesterase [Streptomyces sp. NPDC001678]|uniref:acyl-CoA thioesterase n=1 Tax=Streptomyces sp. NPDC001678 TaxID=3364599 RepID=UPI003689D2F1